MHWKPAVIEKSDSPLVSSFRPGGLQKDDHHCVREGGYFQAEMKIYSFSNIA